MICFLRLEYKEIDKPVLDSNKSYAMAEEFHPATAILMSQLALSMMLQNSAKQEFPFSHYFVGLSDSVALTACKVHASMVTLTEISWETHIDHFLIRRLESRTMNIL